MRRLTALSITALSLSAMTQMVSAADLAVRAPPAYKASPPVYVFSWTGCYVGGNVGGFWSNREWDDAGIFPGDPFATTVWPAGHTSQNSSHFRPDVVAAPSMRH